MQKSWYSKITSQSIFVIPKYALKPKIYKKTEIFWLTIICEQVLDDQLKYISYILWSAHLYKGISSDNQKNLTLPVTRWSIRANWQWVNFFGLLFIRKFWRNFLAGIICGCIVSCPGYSNLFWKLKQRINS